MFTQQQTPSPSNHSPIEQLQSALIMSGLPSTTFELTEITHQNNPYLFIRPTFESEEQEFALSRWVWLIAYDTRFLATDHNNAKGYAIPCEKISAIVSRLRVIDSLPKAALQTYFADHNMNPGHLVVDLEDDYITSSETENDLSVVYSPPENVPDEALEMEQTGWKTATEDMRFTITDADTVSISVADARELLGHYFQEIKTTYWEAHRKDPDWSLTLEH